MANIENLRPVKSKKEARERGRKGGIKSGQVRKEKKTLKEELIILLQTDEGQEKICTALFQQARRGNIKAFEVIRDTVGEKPVEKVEVSQSTDETAKEIDDYIWQKKKN